MLTYTMLSGMKNLNDNIHSYNIPLYSTSYIDWCNPRSTGRISYMLQLQTYQTQLLGNML